jgi:hypothetical protein
MSVLSCSQEQNGVAVRAPFRSMGLQATADVRTHATQPAMIRCLTPCHYCCKKPRSVLVRMRHPHVHGLQTTLPHETCTNQAYGHRCSDCCRRTLQHSSSWASHHKDSSSVAVGG